MSAGNIILADGTTITPEDLQKIAAETKKLLASESKELSQFEEAASLEELTSLPGISQSGTSMKLVRVAMSLLKGVDGKTVELSASETAIQWRYVGESEWKTLVDLSLLKGDKGDPGEKIVLRKGESGIEWKYEKQEDTEYQPLVSIDDIKLKFTDLSEEDKAELTKIPILSTVNAQSGTTSSGSFSSDGRDGNGNPKYILNLTLQKGEKGEYPIIEVGNVITGLPSSEVSVDLTPNGETPEGNPKYLLNLSIPKGEPGQNGDGSGNVFVQETGLVAGKQYLFRPSAPNSASGTLVEYVAPDTSQFITSAVNNLVNYYLKSETYTKEEVTQLLGQLTTINFKVVDVLPESGESNLIYLLKKEGEGKDVHDEYIWVEEKWEIIGSTAVDLTNYYTKEDSNRRFALKTEIPDAITKEAIEAVFTGNIESHTHDTTFEIVEFETDVWDGSSIATSVLGTGTKEDPYIINSCAEWIYFWENEDTLLIIDENKFGDIILGDAIYYVKLTKSLDFNNNTLPYTTKEELDVFGLCDVNGCGATISNIKLNVSNDVTNIIGIANYALYCRFYNFNIKDININIDVTGTGSKQFVFSVFNGYNGFDAGIEFNNYIKANVIINGTNTSNINITLMFGGLGIYVSGTGMTQIINGKQVKFGLDINIVNNVSIGEDAKLEVIKAINCIGNPELGYFVTPVVYDNSHSNITNYTDGKPVYEGNYAEYLGVSGNISDYIYVNGDKSNGFVFTSISADSSSGNKSSFISTQKKTEEEFNSDDFINNILNKEEETFKKGEITPIIKYTDIDYNGYAKQKLVNDIYEKVIINKNIFNTFFTVLSNNISDINMSLDKKIEKKLDKDYYSGYSYATNGTIPINKRICRALFREDTTLVLNRFFKQDLCLIIENDSFSTNIVITLPTESGCIKLTGNTFTVNANKYAKVDFIHIDAYNYIAIATTYNN